MVGGFSVIMNLCVDLCLKLYSPPPVRGEHPPDLLLAVQGAGVLRHEGGGAQAEAQVQGGHPLQGAAVRGAADSVPVMLILSFSASTSMLFKLIHISSISSSYIKSTLTGWGRPGRCCLRRRARTGWLAMLA